MTNSQRGVYYRVGYNHLKSNKCEWNNNNIIVLQKNKPEILQDLADFDFQEQSENIIVGFTLQAKLVSHGRHLTQVHLKI